jgi:hypothetical protein
MPEKHHVIVDGSNLATEGRTLPSLAQLDEAVRAYAAEDPGAEIVVVVDASFEHRIDASERDLLEQAELHGEVVSPPAGAIGRGDAFVLRIAERTGATVLSNDSFQEFHGEHPWLFDEGRLVGGKPVPGVGWIFTPRIPVRGAKSRESTRASRDGRTAHPSEKAAEVAKAAKKVARARRTSRHPDGSAPVVGDVWGVPRTAPAGSAGPGGSGELDGARGAAPTGQAVTEGVTGTAAVTGVAAKAAAPEPAPAKRAAKAAKGAKKAATATKKAAKSTKKAAKTTKKAAKAVDDVDGAKAAETVGATKAAKATKTTKAAKATKTTTAAKATKATKAAKATKVAKAAKATKATKATKAVKATKAGAASIAAPVTNRTATGDGAPETDGRDPAAQPGVDATIRRRGGTSDRRVRAAIAEAMAEVLDPPSERDDGADAGSRVVPAAKGAKRTKRRRTSASPPPAVNDPLTFIVFVAEYPVGSSVEGTVASFTSHGAMIEVAVPEGTSLHCYVPLAGLGDPPPTKAREVLTRGEQRQFRLVGLDPLRRVAELALDQTTNGTTESGGAATASRATVSPATVSAGTDGLVES